MDKFVKSRSFVILLIFILCSKFANASDDKKTRIKDSKMVQIGKLGFIFVDGTNADDYGNGYVLYEKKNKNEKFKKTKLEMVKEEDLRKKADDLNGKNFVLTEADGNHLFLWRTKPEPSDTHVFYWMVQLSGEKKGKICGSRAFDIKIFSVDAAEVHRIKEENRIRITDSQFVDDTNANTVWGIGYVLYEEMEDGKFKKTLPQIVTKKQLDNDVYYKLNEKPFVLTYDKYEHFLAWRQKLGPNDTYVYLMVKLSGTNKGEGYMKCC